MARAVATRSPTAPTGPRSTSRACWKRRCDRVSRFPGSGPLHPRSMRRHTMRLRTSGPAIGLALVLGTAAGCGSEDVFTPELGSKERVISREALARIANRDEGLVQAQVVGDLDGDGIDDALIRTDFGFIA